MVAARDTILEKSWSVVRDLLQRKLMTTAEDRGLTFQVEVEIEDRSVALPELPATAVRPRLPEEVR